MLLSKFSLGRYFSNSYFPKFSSENWHITLFELEDFNLPFSIEIHVPFFAKKQQYLLESKKEKQLSYFIELSEVGQSWQIENVMINDKINNTGIFVNILI